MRIAIFSDVHGNLTALEAVLADIKMQAPDQIVFAGDLCLAGPRPAACLEQVRQRSILSVYGNTDEWVLNPPVPPEGIEEKARRHWQHLNEISGWTQARLSQEERAWLDSLPFEHRISPTAEPQDDLLVVHANPRDVSQVIFPTEVRQREIFGEVQQAQSDDDLTELLEGVPAKAVAFGHLHVPNIRRWRGLTLANISSVSLPGDGDPRAKYGLLTWNRQSGWSARHYHVDYDLQQEVAALEASQLPKWQSYARRLGSNA